MEPTEDDIDVPLTSMSADDLLKLKTLYEHTRVHYETMLKDTTLKEGDRIAVNLCMEEVVNEMKEIDRIIATKEGSVNHDPQ
jgi:hypothetical protein